MTRYRKWIKANKSLLFKSAISLILAYYSISTLINLTCKFPPPQRDLSHMAPMLTVPEVSFSQPASFSLLLQILQQALLLNRCSLPKNS